MTCSTGGVQRTEKGSILLFPLHIFPAHGVACIACAAPGSVRLGRHGKDRYWREFYQPAEPSRRESDRWRWERTNEAKEGHQRTRIRGGQGQEAEEGSRERSENKAGEGVQEEKARVVVGCPLSGVW